jgi:hypothetical protein
MKALNFALFLFPFFSYADLDDQNGTIYLETGGRIELLTEITSYYFYFDQEDLVKAKKKIEGECAFLGGKTVGTTSILKRTTKRADLAIFTRGCFIPASKSR